MLTEAMKAELAENGYLVVDGVVPKPLCDSVIAAVASFLGVDPGAPSTWGVAHGHGIVPLHHHPTLWEVRQHPAVHAVFAELYGSRALWSSVDRASFKPPAGNDAVRVSRLHWDADPRQPKETAGYQGLVYLTDTNADRPRTTGVLSCLSDGDARHPGVGILKSSDCGEPHGIASDGTTSTLRRCLGRYVQIIRRCRSMHGRERRFALKTGTRSAMSLRNCA